MAEQAVLPLADPTQLLSMMAPTPNLRANDHEAKIHLLFQVAVE